jgi:hypothetical protein
MLRINFQDVLQTSTVPLVGQLGCQANTPDGSLWVYSKASEAFSQGFVGVPVAWVLVDDGTGEGQVAKIKTNTADTLELYPQWALTTALSVTDSDIFISRYNTSTEKSAITDKAQNAIGIAQVAFAANDYGWFLRQGVGIVIAGEVLTVDLSFVTGDDTEGQVLKGTAAKGPFDEQALGTVLAANSTVDKGALVKVGIGI